ncbi:MAG: 4-hydroxybenzoate octaprenyltransferase, partial [Wenzhouxiangellaceae bacterium]
PIGIALLLWPTWWGLFLAGQGRPSIANFVIFTLGVVVMRAAGCVINDYADRHVDPHVERTRCRPLAAGELSARNALMLFLGLLLTAFVLVLMTNPLTVLMAFFGALLAGTYPFFKRFTHLPQIALGVAFAWAIPMAFAAETGTLPEPAWWLFALNIVWVLIYDTEYAMADREDDLKVGVKSTAILFGRYDVPVIAGLMGLFTAGLVLFGLRFLPHPAWFAGVAIAFGLLQIQLWRIRQRDPQACFRAFLSNHWVGFTLFAGMLGALLLE